MNLHELAQRIGERPAPAGFEDIQAALSRAVSLAQGTISGVIATPNTPHVSTRHPSRLRPEGSQSQAGAL
jgi:hypothetical protein